MEKPGDIFSMFWVLSRRNTAEQMTPPTLPEDETQQPFLFLALCGLANQSLQGAFSLYPQAFLSLPESLRQFGNTQAPLPALILPACHPPLHLLSHPVLCLHWPPSDICCALQVRMPVQWIANTVLQIECLFHPLLVRFHGRTLYFYPHFISFSSR